VIRALRYRDDATGPEVVELAALDPGAAGTFTWVDCEGPTHEEIAALAAALRLDQLVEEDLHNRGQRTKLDHYTDHLHVALHDCWYRDGELQERELDLAFGSGWLLSVRERHPADAASPFPIEAVRLRFEAQRGRRAAADLGLLLWALIDVTVDRYFEVTDAVDERIDAIEEVILDDDAEPTAMSPGDLFSLSKALLQFRRLAVPLREVLGSILRREVRCIDDSTLTRYQDLYDHALRVADLVEAQRDIVTGLREAQLAMASNRMSLVQQRMAAWGAILIVATLVTGFLGMNFAGAPELDWEEGFGAIIVIILGLCLPLYGWFHRKRWI
jgi:magnesium transporter